MKNNPYLKKYQFGGANNYTDPPSYTWGTSSVQPVQQPKMANTFGSGHSQTQPSVVSSVAMTPEEIENRKRAEYARIVKTEKEKEKIRQNEYAPGLQIAQVPIDNTYTGVNPNMSTMGNVPNMTSEEGFKRNKMMEEYRKEAFWNAVAAGDKAIGQYLFQPAAELFNTPFATFAEGVNAIQGKEYDFGKALPNPTRMAFNAEGMTDMVPQQQFLSDYLGVDRNENPYLALGLDIFTPGPAMVTKPLQALTGIGKSSGAIKYASKMNTLERAIDNPIAFAKKDLNPFYVNEVNPNVGLSFADQSIDATKALQQANQNALNAARQPQLAASATQAVAKEYTPWTQQEMPGLHIKSTMTGSPLEKQLSKTGELNVSNIQAHINRPDVSQQDKFILQKVLNEKFAGKQKIDYNEFRKAVSEELVPLNRTVDIDGQYSNYGVKQLGYEPLKESTLRSSINAIESDAEYYRKLSLDLQNYEKVVENGETIYKVPSRFSNGFAKVPENNIVTYLKDEIKDGEDFFANKYQDKEKYERALKETPSTSVIKYSNEKRFGKGNEIKDENHYQLSTLAHARSMVTKEEPDVVHYLESQSDYWQKVKNPEIGDNVIKEIENELSLAKKELDNFKQGNNFTTSGDYFGSEYGIKWFDKKVKTLEEKLNLSKGDLENPEQKAFLGKTYLERLLQENMQYAAEQGKSKIRYPTRETAAKIQQYPVESKGLTADEVERLNKNIEKVKKELLEISPIDNPRAYEFRLSLKSEWEDILKRKSKDTYSEKHESILRKYSETDDLFKKVYGKKANIITDAKGNTWYEFDIPDAYKKGKAEIKALSINPILGGGAAGAAGATGANQLNQQTPQNRYGGQNPYIPTKYKYGGPVDPVDPEEENKMMQRQINSILSGKPINTGITMTKLNSDEEYTYQQWAKGLTPNLQGSMDDKNYDMRGAWQVGEQPELFYYDNNEFTSAHPIDVKQQGSIYEPHLFSRNPFTGKSLKGPNHPSFMHALEGDIKAGGKVKMDLKTGDMYTYEKGGDTGHSTVEIERSERVYTPDGKLIMETPADAPTHEEGGVKVTLPGGSLVFPKKYFKALDAASGLWDFKNIAKVMLDNAEKAYLSGEPYSSGGKRNKERTYNA